MLPAHTCVDFPNSVSCPACERAKELKPQGKMAGRRLAGLAYFLGFMIFVAFCIIVGTRHWAH